MSRKRKVNKTGRGSSALSSFIALERYLLNSAAWRDLSVTARGAYIELAAGFDGRNNGRIVLGSKTLGERMGCDKTTAARALQELVDHGFVECVKKGGFVCKVRHASEWRLAAFKCDVTGDLPSKLFIRWQPKIQKSVALAAPCGGAGATVSAENAPKEAPRLHPRHREDHFDGSHGGAGATLLYSSHGLVDRNSTPSGGAGKPKARDQRDRIELQSLDNFQTLGTFALKTIAQLEENLPGELQSWEPITSQQKIPRVA